MRHLSILALVLLLAAPAFAGGIAFAANRSCSMSGANVACNTISGRGTLIIEASTADFVALRNAICTDSGYQPEVTCTSEMVTAGQCTAGQLGQQVTNPVSCNQHALRWISNWLRKKANDRERHEAATAASSAAVRDPDIGDPTTGG